jgi:hypothetical protein
MTFNSNSINHCIFVNSGPAENYWVQALCPAYWIFFLKKSVAGDFNLPDINWEQLTINGSQYASKVNQTFLSIIQ